MRRGGMLAALTFATGCGRVGFDASGDADVIDLDGAQSDGPRDGSTDGPGLVSGALAAYSFSEGAGTTTSDRTGNGNDLAVGVGSPTWTTAGHTGDAVEFTTICDGYGTPSPSAALAVTTGLTMMGWVFPTFDPGSGESLVVSYYVNSPESFPYGLEAFDYNGHGGNVECYYQLNPTTYLNVTASKLALNTWTHVACTFDGTNLEIFLDGSLAATQPAPGSIDTTGSGASLIIGCDNAGDQNNLGAFDDIRVYGRALSPSDVQTAMNTPVGP